MAGRPREFDRDKALKRIQAIFWERGYEGVSMADLVDSTGLASARLYAAFGSKEDLFREAVQLYERTEGGFANRALSEESTARDAIERMLRDAVDVYARNGSRGCMVVSAATNCSASNHGIRAWLAEHRRQRTQSIISRLRDAVKTGELPPDADTRALGDAFAAVLHGLSVQARDGVPRKRLIALIRPAMTMLEHPPAQAGAR
jgi:AcrR family transcriptional regulator